MKRRIAIIFVCLCMVLMLLPQAAFAAGVGSPYTAIEGRGDKDAGEGYGKLVDGDPASKWCVTDFKDEDTYIIFSTASPVKVSGYTITTGNDNAACPRRNPKNWVLYGSTGTSNPGKDSDSWQEIHRVTNDAILQDTDTTAYKYAFEKTETAYQYFKLEITVTRGSDVMQMGEFELTDCDHSWNGSVTTKPTCTTSGGTSTTCSLCGGIKYDYMPPLDHDFTGKDGKCPYCGKTEAEYTYSYLDEHGETQTRFSPIEITSTDTEWADTGEGPVWYVVNTDVTIGSRVNVSGDVHLILVNGCTLTVNDGIKLEDENKLTIYGQSGDTGKLIARDGEESGHAAIGGNINEWSGGHNGGILTINGGTVKATSTGGGAAIGGSSNYTGGGGNGGIVTINGGIVTATSTGNGAGIGGGYATGRGGIITINGGIVTATGTDGAGIGGSGEGGSGGTVTINGGEVTATSTNGAGIGGGNSGPGSITAGNVIITGGTVKATSTNGSDIGSGQGVRDEDRFGILLIIGGSVDADDDVSEGIKPDADNSNNLEVFGNVRLPVDLTIPAGKTLTIPSDTSLTIPEERTLTIPKNAALTNSGGTLTNSGKIYVDGTFTGTADNTYYPLTLVKAAAAGDTSEYNDKTYGKTGSDIALTPDTPSTGQEFKQWVVSGVDVTVDENNKFTMPSAAITVSAQFGPATYRIIYEGKNTIENAGALPQTHTYGTATAIPNLTRTGYSFQGWKVNNGETPVKNLTLGATDYTAAISLTPVWTVNQYNISYEGMEGAEYGEYHPAIHTYDTATTISNPTRTGYSFQGWKVNDGETPVKDLTLGATDYTEGISLTAVWTVNQYNIAYEGMEGAEYGEYHPAIHTYDTATTISDPARIGHTFQGWKVNGGETPVKDLTLDGKGYTDNITLTAVWTVDTYTVTLNLNGGTVNSGNVAEYTYGVGAVLPTQVTRINYFFMGWYDNEALTGDPVTAIGTDETGEREYWARWIYVPSQSGWKELEPGSSYYQNGLKVKGLQEIDGKTYYFDEKGYLQTGWVELDGSWYYFDSDMQTGWVKVDGCWYFFDPDTGVMAENSWVLSKGVWYYLGEGGAMLQSRWLLWNDAWYYLGTDGTMLQSRWLQWNGAWYYLGTDGIMLANRWLQWNGAWYYLGTDGVMLTNTVTPDGYKVDASGVWVK